MCDRDARDEMQNLSEDFNRRHARPIRPRSEAKEELRGGVRGDAAAEGAARGAGGEVQQPRQRQPMNLGIHAPGGAVPIELGQANVF